MAEEKKEAKKTTTTKSTTKKKTNNEEVKVEKKFCTNCGKELKEGETCECTSQETSSPVTVTINSDAIINKGKGIFNTLLNILKKPDTTIKEELNNTNSNTCLIIIISLCICFALYFTSCVSAIVSSAKDATGIIGTYINISYFKVFIYGILIYAIMAVIPMFSAFVIGKITRNNDFTFKKSYELYTLSNAPLILAYLVMTLVYVINVNLLNMLGIIGMAIISMFCFFNFILGFLKETKIREDRKSWAVTSILLIWIVVLIIALVVVLGSSFTEIYGKINNSINYTDSFKW